MRYPCDMRIGLAALALVTLACSESNGPESRDTSSSLSNSPGTSVTLHVGETAVVNDIEVAFNAVLEDSRCPEDVNCVWEGNAQVELGVGPRAGGDGPTLVMILNLNHGPRSGEALGQRITLLDIRPAPISTQPIPPGAYEIDLKVERIARSEGRATATSR